MKTGWFKMYRTIVDWEWFKEHDMTCFFIYCLCKANLSDKYWRGTLVKKGQAVISRPSACRDLGIEERRYRTILKRLIKSGEILTTTSEKHTIITIVNWERYQAEFVDEADEIKNESDQRVTNDRPTLNDNIIVVSDCELPPDPQPAEVSMDVADQPSEEVGIETSNGQILDLFFEKDEKTAPQEPPKKKSAPKKKDPTTEEDDPRLDYAFIQKLYNDRCPSLPRCIKLSEKRKTKIRLRFAEMEYSYETLQSVFDKAEASPFLRGENDRRWKCDLEWIMENSDNWVKILEGRYERTKPTTSTPQTYGTTNAITPSVASGFVSQADRNAIASSRQKCDILNTLAECQREFETGNL